MYLESIFYLKIDKCEKNKKNSHFLALSFFNAPRA
jgi:hypothetical protein